VKILYVSDVFPPKCGGSGWSVYFFARALRRRGHDVVIVSLDGPARTFDGFHVRSLPIFRSALPFAANLIRSGRDVPRLATTLGPLAEEADIVHAHHKWSFLALCRAAPQRAQATIRDYWPICICGRAEHLSGAACSSRDFAECSAGENAWKGLLAPLVYPWFENRMHHWRERLRDARNVFCISSYIRDRMLPFLPPNRLILLPNFAEEVDCPQPPELPDRFLLYIGRLESNKGVHLLPSILKESRTTLPLVIVGEGSLQDSLRRQFAETNCTACFLGYRPYAEMLSILRRCEFLLFPSVWPEPLGRVLIEAGMSRRAAIAFDSPGGHHDVIRHNETGLLADSPATFARMIGDLEHNNTLRENLGSQARSAYKSTFSEEAVLTLLLRAYGTPTRV
jgi:glycogen(starch) synthase